MKSRHGWRDRGGRRKTNGEARYKKRYIAWTTGSAESTDPNPTAPGPKKKITGNQSGE